MSDDLVKRLRRGTAGDKERHEAADRIEQLEAGEIEFDRIIGGYASENARFRDRIEKLEAALTHVYAWWPISTFNPHQTIKEIKEFAREALEKKDDPQADL